MATICTTTSHHDRAIAAAERARLAFDLALAADFEDDDRNHEAAAAYDDLIEACPTTVEGIAAVVGYLAYRQQALLDDVDEPEIHSAFQSDADAFCFIQCLDDAMQRMLARQRKPAPRFDGRLSSIFTDPMVRDAFERAERDNGEPAPATIVPEPRRIDGAAVRVLELA